MRSSFKTTATQLVVGLGLAVLAAGSAQAQTTYTFNGTEDENSQRLFRSGLPSDAAFGPSDFPGTTVEDTLFQTFAFNNDSGSPEVFSVNVTNDDFDTFYSVYLGSFDSSNLAANYLGDGGVSGPTSFSVLAPTGAQLILVANTTDLDFTSQSTFTADFIPAVPEASTTVSFGLMLALGLGGVVVAVRKKKAAASL